ncbi:hypothetical protein Tco_1534767 [Tanacetum coccineum]
MNGARLNGARHGVVRRSLAQGNGTTVPKPLNSSIGSWSSKGTPSTIPSESANALISSSIFLIDLPLPNVCLFYDHNNLSFLSILALVHASYLSRNSSVVHLMIAFVIVFFLLSKVVKENFYIFFGLEDSTRGVDRVISLSESSSEPSPSSASLSSA